MSPKKASGKLNKLLGRTMLHVQVGDDLKDFGVHKDLICHYSPYFNAAFTSGFEETRTGVMKLSTTEPEVFELFYHWLYTQDLYLPAWDPASSSSEVDGAVGLEENHSSCTLCKAIDDDDEDSDGDGYDSDYEASREFIKGHDNNCLIDTFHKKQLKLLAMLYVFADMTRIPALQNLCLERFYNTTNTNNDVPVELIEYIWENTAESSQLRKIMIDMLVWEHPASSYVTAHKVIPNSVKDEVLFTMARRFRCTRMNKKGAKVNPLTDITNYHVKVNEKITS
ncbi:hypothetical protein SBOR_2872 [Sclerotinia borealis F-4128]|uniref:BTB domain-containing protein n=1 Tax=Sclerotinia borealis (strain F-4128) TaxID=1432307 RepID=W9CL40_SCLBF|nr:hypothetical protein SBOR_2872 [Sclerotinia borealis F-4128]